MNTHSRPDGQSRTLAPRRALIAIALLVMGFGTAAWGLYLWSDYRITMERANERGLASLDALGEHTRRLIVTNDLVLQQLSTMVQENGVDLYRSSEPAWRRIRDLAELPQQSVILTVMDDTGEVVVSSRGFGPLAGETNYADTAYFAAHRDGTHQGMLIGPTVFSPIDDRPFIVFSRRWEWPDGTFRGAMVSGVRADHFLAFAENLAYGPKSTLSIVRDDGLVLIRQPLTPEVVQLDLEEYELFTDHLVRAPAGRYDAVSPADGERRVVLYRALDDIPVVLIAGLANDDILGLWQSRAFQTGLLLLLAFGATGAITAFGVRHADREALALQQLHAAREHERLLVAEVDHRSRNLLSVIEAQIRQTARHSGTRDELAEKLSGRIQALASAHDLLSAEKWREVDVRTLVEREVLPFADGDQSVLHGESVRVKAKVAMSLAVVLHELATNAVKYGALSVPNGRVDISWEVHEGAGPGLQMVWQESGGPPVEPPGRKGFGTTLIERSLPHDLGGAVSLQFLPQGVRAEFTIPLRQNAAGEPAEGRKSAPPVAAPRAEP